MTGAVNAAANVRPIEMSVNFVLGPRAGFPDDRNVCAGSGARAGFAISAYSVTRCGNERVAHVPPQFGDTAHSAFGVRPWTYEGN
jgi:hypothetical protein